MSHPLRALTAAALAAALAAPALAAPPQIDLKAIDAIAGDARMIVYGEDSHGMMAVHELVPMLFEHMVESKGVRVFYFESAWGFEDALQGFMDSDRTEVTPEESFFLNAFNSRPIVDMLIWARGWNRAHPADKIRFAGYQPEQPVYDRGAIRALFAKTGAEAEANAALAPCLGGVEASTNIEFISAMGAKRRKQKLPSYTPEERAACLANLDGLRGRLVRGKTAFVRANGAAAYEEGLMHVLSLRTYVGVLTAILDEQIFTTVSKARAVELDKLAYTEGDKARFEIFQVERGTRYGDAKSFLWMHNWHAFKHADRTGMGEPGAAAYMPSLATRLAAAYGDGLRAIGTIVPCAAAPADGSKPGPGVCQEPEGSLELAFKARFDDTPAVVDFHDPKAVGDLPIAKSGRLYANFHKFGFVDVVLRDQFDGVVYLPSDGGVAK